MLYGKKEVWESIIQTGLVLANKKKIRVIFCSVINSLGRGTHCYDSDYDVRFLYVNDDFPHKIYYPLEHSEEEYKFSYTNENDSIYHHISFWDATAFLQFIKTPKISGSENLNWGLLYIVKKVLFAPYTWDPFGLQMKIAPIIEESIRLEDELNCHISEINGRFDNSNQKVNLKNYIIAGYEALALNWNLKFNRVAPISIETLFVGNNNIEVEEKMRNLLDYHRYKRKMHNIRGNVEVDREAVIDAYIYENMSKTIEKINKSKVYTNIGEQEKNIECIYNIIFNSMNDIKVNKIND